MAEVHTAYGYFEAQAKDPAAHDTFAVAASKDFRG
jgi:hypothetical protein